jgi:hypothetical protein
MALKRHGRAEISATPKSGNGSRPGAKDKDDNEIESDLYSVKIFGKNIRIAPGKSKDVNPKCIYFYVYAIKNEKVVAKLGVYEKELSSLEDKPEIYDLTQFKDGSLLLFDVYYNKPDLISNLEELLINDVYDKLVDDGRIQKINYEDIQFVINRINIFYIVQLNPFYK